MRLSQRRRLRDSPGQETAFRVQQGFRRNKLAPCMVLDLQMLPGFRALRVSGLGLTALKCCAIALNPKPPGDNRASLPSLRATLYLKAEMNPKRV